MKKFLLSIICVLTCVSGAWATTYTVTYSSSNGGTFYYSNGTEVNPKKNDWSAAKWVSGTSEPIVTISNPSNNAFRDDNYNLANGRTYTISVTGAYKITRYTISSTGWGSTVTPEGGEGTVFTSGVLVQLDVTGLNTKSTSFSNAGANLPNPTIVITLESIPYGTLIENEFGSLFTESEDFGSYFMLKDASTKSSLKSNVYDLRNEITSEADYTSARTAIMGGIKYPATGYYRIKSSGSRSIGESYIAYGKSSARSSYGLITKEATDANKDATTVFFLSKLSGGKYTMSVEGLNVQNATNSALVSVTTETAKEFTFTIVAPGYISITVDGGEFEYFHEGDWTQNYDFNGVVGWSIGNGSDASSWMIEDAGCFDVGASNLAEIAINLNEVASNDWYATAYFPYDVQGYNVNAYTCVYDDVNKQLVMTEITGCHIPKNTGVILWANSSPANFKIRTSGDEFTTDNENQLAGTNVPKDVSSLNTTDYYLGYDATNGVGFYHWAGTRLAANRAYLPANVVSTSLSNGYKLVFADDNDVTAVAPIIGESVKGNAQLYDLQGRKVTSPRKGQIYIQNGKAVLY